MPLKIIAVAAAATAVLVASAAPGLAQRKPTKCSSILAVCLQRAPGQTGICDDMFQRAVAQGQWQATEEADGTKHAAVPCTK